MVDQKKLNTVIESIVSETITEHPHSKDEPCTGCKIVDALKANKKIRNLCARTYLLQMEERSEFPRQHSEVYDRFEMLCMGFEIVKAYYESEHLNRSYTNASEEV